MKIFPFVLKTSQGSLKVRGLSVFLAHAGKSLWQTEEETLSLEQLRDEYLLPNGLIPKQIKMDSSIAYVEIDMQKTKRDDFYTWEESLQNPAKPECWRLFSFFTDEKGAEWFTSRHFQADNLLDGKPVHEYYEDILRDFSME
jgi:hypothetical protein